ncbi:hypothetical protein [Actinoplanes sichuanensis]|uniref:Uncharacterized protein n=1 Tax=Actinoplanes sichuanensis TaxID=512349 RepID=A0ABW4ALL1_9ACTN|nr:hypothetical protein [Actinoplanes sichuanensis]
MNTGRSEAYGAASGLALPLLGVAAMVFERSPVTAADFAAIRRARGSSRQS